MAPVSCSITGLGGQKIEDPQLRALLDRLRKYGPGTSKLQRGSSEESDDNITKLEKCNNRIDVEGLVEELERWPQWRFHELVSYPAHIKKFCSAHYIHMYHLCLEG